MSTPDSAVLAAVDLGASSGRVITGRVTAGRVDLTEIHRFANRPVRLPEGLRWDIHALYTGVLDGLKAAGEVDSVGIDSWAVDYGLLDADGHLLSAPVHYRDTRTDNVPEQVWQTVPAEQLYARTGIQHAPFNTLYQLVAAQRTAQASIASGLLLIPDLITYWLTGEQGTEVTNASTTQLLDASTGTWAEDIARPLGIDLSLFAPLRAPGDKAGTLLPDVLQQLDLQRQVPVTTVASHDTASAVAAVPAGRKDHFAYICTGTWSLVGLELSSPVLTEASRLANFTNEAGIDGTVRYLRNVMGLWLLQECMRDWGDDDVVGLLREAASVKGLRSVIDASDTAFLAPGLMPRRIAQACSATGQPEPVTRGQITRCILDSLALAHRRAIEQAQELSGRHVDIIHMVGGAARNRLLCQLTADASGLPVVAGPVEAAALGNVLVQARALGLVGDVPQMRQQVADSQPLHRYEPSGDRAAWDAAARRISG
ncbi:rhamnulokinase [Streptomyces sp. NBC_01237]|uniref:rhamnulokinase n=1 Tax=Streptomyces sp. NBC_01237 TaxID=2903790 RepID=UPI002DDBDA25|nr:rhamnulokinase family protein [Streptomyces sp. NBC_01237]WRZ78096.1 rhamnulokinase [Streptomyces sp. NBC_01237]